MQFDTSLLKWSKVNKVVERVRAASAPGPNGLPYEVYKNCPRLLKLLWKLIGVAWKTQIIPSVWRRVVTTFIPKEKKTHTLS